MLPEADADGLLSTQITYVDPDSGNICRRDVFYDPADFEGPRRREGRFLISSDLVNLISDAVKLRRERFMARHEALAKYRFGYTCALHRLRLSVDRIAAQARQDGEAPCVEAAGEADDEEEAPAMTRRRSSVGRRPPPPEPQQDSEVCPIHYYRAELYLDSYTYERLTAATREWRKFLEAAIRNFKERINELGGAGWYDLLQKMLRKGATSTQVGDKLLALVADEAESREIEDKISGGVRSLYDKLKPTVDGLDVEHKDCKERRELIEAELRAANTSIAEGERRISEIKRRLKDPPPYLRPESESEESEEEVVDNSAFLARIAAMKRDLFAEWAATLAEAREEAARLKAILAEWEAKYGAYDRSELAKLQEELAGIEASMNRLRKKLDKLSEKAQEAQAKTKEVRAQIEEEESQISSLQHRLSTLPDPPPRNLRFVQLQKELARLLAEEERIKRKMLIPINKVKAIRYELRGLYKKLGWEWDFSDSEDDEDKPYWQRRKLAVDGLTPFDPNDFVYQERTFQGRRHKNRAKREQAKQASHLLAQMVASRQLHSDHVAELMKKEMKAISRGLRDEPSAGPFQADAAAFDSVERSLQAVQQQLSDSLRGRSSVRTTRESAKIQTACARLLRLHEMRMSTLEKLRTCARAMPEALAPEGPLAGPRSKLMVLVAALCDRRLETDLLDEGEEADEELDGTCISIHDVVGQAVHASDKVNPIMQLLRLSIDFADLRVQMADWRRQRRLALSELMEAAGPDALAGLSTALPSLQSGSLQEASFMSSPGGASPMSRSGSLLDRSLRSVEPLRRPPPFEAVCEPLGGSTARRRTVRGPEWSGREVDCGFRPDGEGEEPLESWSLFKVSKSTDLDASLKPGGDRTGKSSEARAARLAQRIAGASTDFREYVAQTKQSSKEMWHSASAPELLDPKRRTVPSLPQLVRPEQTSPAPGAWKSAAQNASELRLAASVGEPRRRSRRPR